MRVLLILLGVTVVMFLLIHAIPGSPLNNFANAENGTVRRVDDGGKFPDPIHPQV